MQQGRYAGNLIRRRVEGIQIPRVRPSLRGRSLYGR
jgi:hypothetical protein